MSFEAVFDDQKLRKFLERITKNTKSAAKGLPQYAGLISVLVFRDVIEHFEQEMGSKGPWHRLTERYAKERPQGKILQISGHLRQSFKPTNYKSVADEGLFWYNNATTKSGFPYAFAHNKGGPILPKRDFMWISGVALKRIADQTVKFMMDKGR